NLRARDEVRIYQKMLKTSGLESVHIPPLALPAASKLAVLTRLEPPVKKGAALMDKLRAYDWQRVETYSQDDIEQERLCCPEEGMSGISPRYIINRLISAASGYDARCVTPLKALDSIWRGLNEDGTLEKAQAERHIAFIKDVVDDYNQRAIETVQKASVDAYERTASEVLAKYLADIGEFVIGQSSPESEREMREVEKFAGVSEKRKVDFRREMHMQFEEMKRSGLRFDYTSEPRLKEAIEKRLLPDFRTLRKDLSAPKSASIVADWRKRRGAAHHRLVSYYHYCPQCAEDIVEYVLRLLRGKRDWQGALKVRGSDIEWLWELDPKLPSRSSEESSE
ncbi:MAG: hypothetical protein ACRDIB_14285, partial [Ardenticatenaceae bacterium]